MATKPKFIAPEAGEDEEGEYEVISEISAPSTMTAAVPSTPSNPSPPPSRRLARDGEYWASWPDEWKHELKEELMDIPRRQMTDAEAVFTFSDRIQSVQIGRESVTSLMLKRKVLSHKLPKEDIEELKKIPVKCIENHANKENMIYCNSGGTGFTQAWFPPVTTDSKGVDFYPALRVDAYGENFLPSNDSLEKAGFKVVDYNPDNPYHTGNVGAAGGGVDISIDRDAELSKMDSIHNENDRINKQLAAQERGEMPKMI